MALPFTCPFILYDLPCLQNHNYLDYFWGINVIFLVLIVFWLKETSIKRPDYQQKLRISGL